MKRLFSLTMAALFALTTLLSTLQYTAYADSTNLIANPGAETTNSAMPINWTPDSWGTGSSVVSVVSGAHTGNNAMSIVTTNRTDGDAKWMPDAVAVTAGQQYTYTNYYQASVSTELDIAYTSSNGTVSYGYLTAISASSSWQQATATFTVPTGVIRVAVMHILATTGSLVIDDASLTSAATTTPTTPPVTNPTDGANLLANPSVETASGASPANWQTGGWGTNTAGYTYSSTGHTGSRSATVAITAFTDGDAKWFADPVAITAGQQYTYSDYYTSNVPTRVVADYTVDGTDTYVELPAAAASAAAGIWTQYSTKITAPTGVTKVTFFHLIDRVGTLSIDDASLVQGTDASTNPTTPTTPTDPLSISNPSVETSTNGTTPDNWTGSGWGTNDAAFSYVADAHTGSRSVKTTITSYTSGNAMWFPAPLTGLKDGDNYHFTAWLKTNTQPMVQVGYTMADGSEVYDNLAVPTSLSASTWQQYTANFTAPAGATAMSIYIMLSRVGWLQVDDYALSTYTPTGFSNALVSLDFDDGWTSIYTNGLPLLKKYGLVSTQYIISGFVGASQYMTKAQIKSFQSAGHEIGSHTVDHADLTTLTAAQLKTELQSSQTKLRSLFGSSVATELASPYGNYNAAVLASAKQYYVSHRSVDVGFNSKDNFNAYNIVVQNVTATTTNAQVQTWVDQAIKQKTWLVLVYHQVENTVVTEDTEAVKTSDLNTQLAYIKSTGVTVKTQAAALKDVQSQIK